MFKKSLLTLLLVVVLSVVGSLSAVAVDVFEKVTDASTLKAGDVVTFVNESASTAIGTQNVNNFKEVTVSIVGNEFSAVDNLSVFELGYSDEKWTFKIVSKNEYLYPGGTSTKNYLKSKETLNGDNRATITISEGGDASITFVNWSTDRQNIRYNKSNKLFSCYQSGNLNPIQLYRKKSAADPSKKNTTLTFEDTEAKIYTIGEDVEGFTNVATLDPAVEGATITYESSNEEIATVNESTGEVTVLTTTAGSATITATYAGNDTYNGSTASYTITVNKKNPTNTEGEPYTVAQARDIITNQADYDLTQEVYVKGIVTGFNGSYYNSYYIKDEAGTDDLYIYSGKGIGGATLGAGDLAVGDEVVVKGKLTLYNNSVYEINSGSVLISRVTSPNAEFDAADVYVQVGGTATQAVTLPEDYDGTVTYSSTNANVTVDATGNVTVLETATADETAVVTAKAEKSAKYFAFEVSYNVHVTAPLQDATLAVSETAKTLKIGDTFTPSLTTESDATTAVWESDATDVATVSEAGVITAKGYGTANITVYVPANETYNTTNTVTIEVKVVPTIVVYDADGNASEFTELPVLGDNEVAVINADEALLSEDVKNASNVIINGVAKQLVLTDLTNFAPGVETFTAEAVAYERNNTQGWNSVCLPFEVATSEITNYFGTDAEAYVLTNYNEGANSVQFTKVGEFPLDAESVTEFNDNGTDGDGSSLPDVAEIIESSTDFTCTAVANKVYLGKTAMGGLKFGASSSNGGSITLTANAGVKASSISVKAASYGSDSNVTIKLTVNGTDYPQITLTSAEYADYIVDLGDLTDIETVVITGTKANKGRFYLASITLLNPATDASNIATSATNELIPAGTPMLIKNETSTTWDVNAANVNCVNKAKNGNESAGNLVGSFKEDATLLATDGFKLLSDGTAFGKAAAGSKVFPFRAALVLPGASEVRQVSVDFKDEATAIGSLIDKQLQAGESIYDAQGRRVVKITAPGLYIQGGKKFIKK